MGSVALLHGDPPGPGLEPVSPVLAGGFLTTAPPGKLSINFVLKRNGLEIAMCSAVAKDSSEKTPKICTAYVIPLPNKLVQKKAQNLKNT